MHTFQEGPDGLCVEQEPGQTPCGMDRWDPRHRIEGEPVTEEMAAPYRPVLDAPADDESIARAAGREVDTPAGETWRKMADRLVGWDEVTAGPWPVRKVYLKDNNSLDTVLPYLEALAGTGQMFVMRTYWTLDNRSMYAVITWGDWFGWEPGEIRNAVLG